MLAGFSVTVLDDFELVSAKREMARLKDGLLDLDVCAENSSESLMQGWASESFR